MSFFLLLTVYFCDYLISVTAISEVLFCLLPYVKWNSEIEYAINFFCKFRESQNLYSELKVFAGKKLVENEQC